MKPKKKKEKENYFLKTLGVICDIEFWLNLERTSNECFLQEQLIIGR